MLSKRLKRTLREEGYVGKKDGGVAFPTDLFSMKKFYRRVRYFPTVKIYRIWNAQKKEWQFPGIFSDDEEVVAEKLFAAIGYDSLKWRFRIKPWMTFDENGLHSCEGKTCENKAARFSELIKKLEKDLGEWEEQRTFASMC